MSQAPETGSRKNRGAARALRLDHCRTALRRGATALSDLIFPAACQLCQREFQAAGGIHLCPSCRHQLKSRLPLCPACAMPLPPAVSSDSTSCPSCRNERYWFSSVQALGVYEELLRDAVLRMKRAHEDALTLTMGKLLGELLGEKICCADSNPQPDNPSSPDLVVSVPMHWTRRMVRGTNPSELLAETIAEKLCVPAALDVLKNRRKTRKQGTLLPDQRRQNVRGAFCVSAGYDIKDTFVLLVDDVMTTGATGNEIAKVLRRAGASKVAVAVVARGTG